MWKSSKVNIKILYIFYIHKLYIHKLYFFSKLRVAIIKANFSKRKITNEINKIYNDLQTTSVQYLQLMAKME